MTGENKIWNLYLLELDLEFQSKTKNTDEEMLKKGDIE